MGNWPSNRILLRELKVDVERRPGELPAVLEGALHCVLRALGLEMGAVWFHPHRRPAARRI